MHALGLYSQRFVFFLTYKWAQLARVLHYTRLVRHAGENTGIVVLFINSLKSVVVIPLTMTCIHKTIFSP
jgi:hypothetical protein